MTITYQQSLLVGIVAAIFLLATALFFTKSANANPSQIIVTASAPASTTLSYIFPAIGTTSPLVVDMLTDGSLSGESATLTTCLTASTTNSAISMNVEYSQDGITYAQNQLFVTSSSTPNVIINVPQSTFWQFASSSLAGGSAGGSSICKIINVPTPTRFARVYFYLPLIGAGNTASSSGVWAQWQVKRENR